LLKKPFLFDVIPTIIVIIIIIINNNTKKKHEKKNLGKDEIILKKQNKIAALKAENKTEQLIYL